MSTPLRRSQVFERCLNVEEHLQFHRRFFVCTQTLAACILNMCIMTPLSLARVLSLSLPPPLAVAACRATCRFLTLFYFWGSFDNLSMLHWQCRCSVSCSISTMGMRLPRTVASLVLTPRFPSCTHTHTHTYTHTHTHTHVVCAHVCVYVHARVCIHTHTRVCITYTWHTHTMLPLHLEHASQHRPLCIHAREVEEQVVVHVSLIV